MEARRYAEACPKFAESQRLDPGGGTQLNLALCHEKEGKTATAWSEFNVALSQAIRDGRRDRIAIARERAVALEALLPRLTVLLAPAAEVPGLEVRLDGVAIRGVAWNAPAAVDPGSHRVDATAPGRAPWSILVPLEGGERRQVVVPLLAVDPSSATLAAPPPGALAPPPPVAWETVTKPNPVFYAVLAIGAAGLAASAVTGAFALKAHNTSLELCQPTRQYCSDPSGVDAAGTAHTLALVSTVALGAGVVAGLALFLVPSRVSTARPPQVVRFAPLPGGAAASWSGAF